MFQPLSYRFVVEFQTQPCRANAAQHGGEGYGPCFGKGVDLVLDEPHVENVHQWVVYDVERIRQITEEFVDTHS